jgi:hypothetical protein
LAKSGFYSARILIHRTFLITAAYSKASSAFSANVNICLTAARETIHLIYNTFINRPFFRTWWYNTTYAFNAIKIILYVLVSPLQPENGEELLNDVEKTLKILRAMSGVAVARRCAELTEEIFEIAKVASVGQRQGQRKREQNHTAGAGRKEGLNLLNGIGGALGSPEAHLRDGNGVSSTTITNNNKQPEFDVMNETFFSDIMDMNFLGNFDAHLSAMDFNGSPFETMDLDWNPLLK